jgi:head-tail adaptor
MRAGSLRDLVRLDRNVPAGTDAHGAPIDSWKAVGLYHADVRAVKGSEPQIAGQQAARLSYLVKLRDAVDVRAGDRLVWLTRTESRVLNPDGPPVRDRVERSILVPCIEPIGPGA